ncbi:Mov34/MPN/PAD-1 family protein [Calothrix sp. 336/3]|uniref:Mov34/MPN/PAD-1 family protein n=1 Tax=Calothrix sp. 336/3 TaxID=1337936 RepID=UPI0004E2E64A|nr:M67 family metallopeptidase [Calothrix sp. 336/3]AKG20829.1 hypothetical protein IJ00_05460 [Calothrix sp. 336/3]
MIIISYQHLQIIYNHGESAYPEECCGLLLGYIQEGKKTVVEVIPTKNAWQGEAENFSGKSTDKAQGTPESQRRRYAIAPQTMLQVQKQAREKSLEIIGIFHSHPDYPSIPSEFDRLYAWQGYSYVITSIHQGKRWDIHSWVLDDNQQFQEEIIENSL